MSLVTVHVRGIDRVNLTLGRLEALPTSELGPTLTVAGAILLDRIRKRFLQQIDPSGVRWPVSDAARKRALGAGGGTLFDTGRLFRSITVKKSGPLRRIIFTKVPYAASHQFGRGNVQRVFLGFSAADIIVLTALVEAQIEKAIRGT